MKKVFLSISIIMLLLVSCFANKSKESQTTEITTIKGKYLGELKSDLIKVTFNGIDSVFTVNEETGEFSGSIALDQDQFVGFDLFGQNDLQLLYVTKGESLNLEIEIKSLRDQFINGKMKGQPITDAYKELIAKLDGVGIDIYGKGWEKNLVMYPQTIVKIVDEHSAMLKKNNKAFRKISKDYKQYFDAMYNAMLKMSQLRDKSYAELKTELSELANYDYNKYFMLLPFVDNYAERVCFLKAATQLKKTKVEYETLNSVVYNTLYVENVIDNVKSQELKNVLLTKFLSTELPLNGAKNQYLVEQVINELPKEDIAHLIAKYEAEKGKVIEKQESTVKGFNFEFEDKDGKKYRLTDFADKLVYVDCWASWCMPCRGQIPFLKSLEKKYEGKDIVFLSVSLDQTKDAWLKAVKEEDLHGYVLYAPGAFRNEFAKYYNINSIPRFLLFDKAGNLINDEMPKPIKEEQSSQIIDTYLNSSTEVDEIVAKSSAKVDTKSFNEKMLRVTFSTKFAMFGMNMDAKIHDGKIITAMTWQKTPNIELLMGKDYDKPTISKKNFKEGNQNSSWRYEVSGFELYTIVKDEWKLELKSKDGDYYVVHASNGKENCDISINKETYLVDKIDAKIISTVFNGGGSMEIKVAIDEYKQVNGFYQPVRAMINGQKREFTSYSFEEVDPMFFE